MQEQFSGNTFNEEGRLLQVEYAIKNVSNAGTIVGVVCSQGIVILGINKGAAQKHKEKIYAISDEIFVGLCGIFGDAMRLKKYAQVKVQDIQEEYGRECPLPVLCKMVGKMKQKYTQYGGSRPFGVSFLYAGQVEGDYALFSTDPSGTINKWKGMCYGENEDNVNNGLRNDFPEGDMDLKTATKEVMKILSKVRECGTKETNLIEILHYSKEEKRFLTHDEIYSLLEEVEGEVKG